MNLKPYITDHKFGKPVLSASGESGSYDKMAVDSPYVFYHNNQYYMMHTGFDGKGYQTGLAVSDDVIHWNKEFVILPRRSDMGWDHTGIAGMWLLKNDNLFERPTLKKVNNKYWMVYHSYPEEGYEQGPAEIGLAYTEDESLRVWTRLERPILTWKDGNEWERGGLYKGCLIESNGRFYMFYNAKDSDEWIWHEQIGVVVSDNMIEWKRINKKPVIEITDNSWDSHFCADPFVAYDGNQWVMFYYGYNGEHAQEGIAFSKDLLQWEKYTEPILRYGKVGELDSIHAHKPSIVFEDGILYHFYCAVRESRKDDGAVNQDPTSTEQSETEFRCITVATSE